MTLQDEYDIRPLPHDGEMDHTEGGQGGASRCTVIFARDVPDSTAVWDRTEMALGTFTEIEQVLNDFYDTSDLQYVCFDRDAYTVEKHEFFKPQMSGGRTRTEPAYKTVAELVESGEGDTYVFLASDDDLHPYDDTDAIRETVAGMPADLHAYLAVNPREGEDGVANVLPAPGDGGPQCFVLRDDDDRTDVVMDVVDAINTILDHDEPDDDAV